MATTERPLWHACHQKHRPRKPSRPRRTGQRPLSLSLRHHPCSSSACLLCNSTHKRVRDHTSMCSSFHSTASMRLTVLRCAAGAWSKWRRCSRTRVSGRTSTSSSRASGSTSLFPCSLSATLHGVALHATKTRHPRLSSSEPVRRGAGHPQTAARRRLPRRPRRRACRSVHRPARRRRCKTRCLRAHLRRTSRCKITLLRTSKTQPSEPAPSCPLGSLRACPSPPRGAQPSRRPRPALCADSRADWAISRGA